METITVIYNGMMMLVSKFVADQLQIKDGHKIQTQTEFWKMLSANAEHNLTAIKGITEHSKN